MLDLDMEILAAFRAKKLITTIIRAYKGAINFNGRSPHMLFPPALAGSIAIGRLRRVIQKAIIILIRCGDSQGPTRGADLIPEDQRLLLGFQDQLLLLLLKLLLAKAVQELVRLGHDLRDKSVVVEVFDVYYFAIHLEVFICSLVYVRDEIFVLEIHSKVFFIIVNFWAKLGELWDYSDILRDLFALLND